MLQASAPAEFNGRCGACTFREICGGSRARAFAAFGDPLAEDPACAYQPASATVAAMAPQGIGRLRPADILVGALASAGAVALVTAIIGVVDAWIPVISLGALYVFAVLFVSVVWGLAFALPVAVASMLAFNWFFLPPTHTLHLRDGENWLVLAALPGRRRGHERARRARPPDGPRGAQREREAALLAEVAVSLLGGSAVTDELDEIAGRAAIVLGVAHASIVLGAAATEPPDAVSYPLAAGGRALGAISMPGAGPADERVVRRFLPALASLLAVALDREELEREALEAEALRHSDAVKTTVLRAVSHDLRSPLTAIAAAAGGLAEHRARPRRTTTGPSSWRRSCPSAAGSSGW